MKKVISFSLWGKQEKYTYGAIENAKIARHIYPGWKTWFYIAVDVPGHIKHSLKEHADKIIEYPYGTWDSMFWRFYPASDIDVDVFISRDTDSRLNYREKAAVDEWLQSGKRYHIMRDHAYHRTQVLGGMWGMTGNWLSIANDIMEFIMSRGKSNHYDVDQAFLREILYPKMGDDVCVHDSQFEMKPFPTPRENGYYVGSQFDEHNNGPLIKYVGK